MHALLTMARVIDAAEWIGPYDEFQWFRVAEQAYAQYAFGTKFGK